MGACVRACASRCASACLRVCISKTDHRIHQHDYDDHRRQGLSCMCRDDRYIVAMVVDVQFVPCHKQKVSVRAIAAVASCRRWVVAELSASPSVAWFGIVESFPAFALGGCVKCKHPHHHFLFVGKTAGNNKCDFLLVLSGLHTARRDVVWKYCFGFQYTVPNALAHNQFWWEPID